MAFESGYRRLQFSDEPAQPQHNVASQGLALGMAAGAGVGLFAYGVMPRADGTRRIDDLAKYARTAGNLTPFQIGNTFRIPEWLSPFTSPAHQELTQVGSAFQMEIGGEYLKNSETFSYLKQLTGMDSSKLAAAGILPRGIGHPGSVASKLVFEKTSEADINGRLYSVVGNQRHLLHANAALLQFSGETGSSGDFFSKNEPVNKVAKSVFAEMDMWGAGNWKEGGERRAFTHRKGPEELLRPSYIPIPGIRPTVEGSTYLRATSTFSMERFNQLLHNTGEEILGQRATGAIKKLGLGFGVTSGPSHVMYGRFGMKMAGLIGAGLLLNESDWWRRQGGVAGQTVASAGVSFGIGAVVAKAGFGGKAGMMAGLAAFAGQMILPGFDQGVLPGVASTWALGTEVRAFKANPFSSYRQTLEGLLPGVSGIGMGLAAGVALAAGSYVKVPGTGQSLPNFLLNQVGHKAFGLARRSSNQMDVMAPKNIRDHFWDMTLDWASKNVSDPQLAGIMAERQRIGGYTTMGMRSKVAAAMNRTMSPADVSGRMNTLWAQAEDTYKNLRVANPVNAALKDRLTDIDLRYAGKNDIASKGFRQLENVREQVRHSFFGADIAEESMSKFMKHKGFTGAFGRAGMLFATGLMTHQLATGALLGSMNSREELQDIYSGRQLVEIESGRYWEGGGSPWEGKDRSVFRAHWFAQLMNRTRQTGIWGECLTPEGLLVTTNGLVRADCIQTGDKLITHLGNEKAVSSIMIRNVDESVYSLTTRLNEGLPVSATGNHPVLVLRPNRRDNPSTYTRDWITLEELYVQYSNANTRDKWRYRLFVPYWEPDSLITSMVVDGIDYELNEDFGRLLGYYASEGHCDVKGVYFSFDKKEVEYHTDVANLMKRFFNLEVHPVPAKDNEGIKLEFYSRKVARIVQVFISGQVRGGYDKKLNEKLLFASNVFLYGFLDGLIKGDGSLEEGRKVSIQMAETPMVHQFRLLFLRLKLHAGCLWMPATDNRHTTVKYRLDTESIHLLNQFVSVKDVPIGTIQAPRKSSQTIRFADGFGVLINDFKQIDYQGPVYDFEISGDHSFLTVGFIAHNSEDSRSPLTKAFLSNFTYTQERETYYDRPYPMSSAFGANIPIIGPILGATIGQLIKPAKIMHSGEWIQSSEGNLSFASVYEGWKREPAYNLGAAQPGIPTSPFSPGSVYSDLNAQFRDLGGLAGFASNTISNIVLGQDTFFTDSPRLAEAGMMNSHRRAFWDMSLGGGGPIGEAVRRVLPAFSKDYERINPLMNSMPAWLPAQFHWGDQYATNLQGESALPGAGYERLHPELRGTDPENYPLIYQYDILSQVSPKSANLRDTREKIYRARASGAFSEEAEQWIDRIDHVIAKQWNTLDFDRVDENAIELPGISRLTQAGWFGAREKIRAYAAPVENLLPIRPVQKLLGGDRDPIEQYEYERLYQGGGNAFWDKPFRDYLRPSMYSLANLMGFEGKPAWRVEADATNKVFDEFEFNKWMTLAQQAQAMGDTRRKIQYEYQASNTRMGVNPQGNPLSIYWSLPAEDRAFFNAFAFAEGKDRDRVLQMIPTDQSHLYQSLWSRMDTDPNDPRLWAGNPTDPDEEYLFRQFYGQDPDRMPPADWIGRNEDISLGDIKVRYVDELAKDMRDYCAWDSQRRDAMSQPILEDSTGVIHREMSPGRGGITRRLREMFGGSSAKLNVFESNATNGSFQVQHNDDRKLEIQQGLSEYSNGRY